MFPTLLHLIASAITLVAPAPAPHPNTVELSELHQHPVDHLAQEVRFYVQLDQQIPQWNAFTTRFGPETYRAFRVWGDDQRLWDVESFYRPMGRIFVKDAHVHARRLAGADRFQRFLVVGKVHNVLMGEPWIEVEHLYKSRQSVPEGSLLHATRGLSLIERGALGMASDEFDRALVAKLPDHVREDLLVLKKSCQEPAK